MSNMSYCRFHNTLGDLRDCTGALEDLSNGEGSLSESERVAAHRLIEECQQLVDRYINHKGDIELPQNPKKEEDE